MKIEREFSEEETVRRRDAVLDDHPEMLDTRVRPGSVASPPSSGSTPPYSRILRLVARYRHAGAWREEPAGTSWVRRCRRSGAAASELMVRIDQSVYRAAEA
jgi:hypothetical protein